MLHNPAYSKMIEQICRTYGVAFQRLSQAEEIFLLQKNGHHHYVFSRRFPMNSESAGRIMDNIAIPIDNRLHLWYN